MLNYRKCLVVYHRVDCDGLCSFLVTKKYYESKGIVVEGLGWNYGDEIPNIDPQEYTTITLVDISFPADVMLKLYESKKLVWIDHHITAINDSETHGYNDSEGIRKDGTAACILCWKYFNPKKEVPLAIEFLGAYDTWTKDGDYDWEEVIYPFQVGFKNRVELNILQWDLIWNDLIQDEVLEDEIINPLVSNIVNEGLSIVEYERKKNKPLIKKYGFDVLVDGKYKGICILNTVFGSTTFESVLDEYDIYIVVNRISKDYYNISMYKEPGRLPDFSCGEYLKENYCGGGHSGAGGGKLNLQQLITLLENETV